MNLSIMRGYQYICAECGIFSENLSFKFSNKILRTALTANPYSIQNIPRTHTKYNNLKLIERFASVSLEIPIRIKVFVLCILNAFRLTQFCCF